MSEQKRRVRVGGLWMNPAGNCLSGTWGGLRLVAFLEREKKSDRSPDWVLYLEEEPREQDGKGAPPRAAPAQRVSPRTEAAARMAKEAPATDDDLPF